MPPRLTDAQRRRIDELATSCAETPSAASVSGATIVCQFARYLDRSDANEIKRALYRFLMGTCDFIAHNGLIPPDGGFRYAYAEPRVLIEELYRNDRSYLEQWHGRTAPRQVYSDGQTDREVYAQVLALAREHDARTLRGVVECKSAPAGEAPVYRGPNPAPPVALLDGAIGWRFTKAYPEPGRWEPTGWLIVHPNAVRTYGLDGEILRDGVLWAAAGAAFAPTPEASVRPTLGPSHERGDPRSPHIGTGDDAPHLGSTPDALRLFA
jgi:hypothetical protein